MKLRPKIILVASLTTISLLVILLFISSYVIVKDLLSREKEDILSELSRANYVITEELKNLSTTTSDWAYWDDTYLFIKDQNADYITSNLSADSLRNINIDVFLLYDTSVNVILDSLYLDMYYQVITTGKSKQFEVFFPPMQKYFNISAFPVGKNLFATVYEDITYRKQAEETREELIKALQEKTEEMENLLYSNRHRERYG